MVQRIKFILSLLVLTLSCSASVAQEQSIADESSKISAQINYQQYLSESAKKAIAAKITQARIAESIRSGTLLDNIGAEAEAGAVTLSLIHI